MPSRAVNFPIHRKAIEQTSGQPCPAIAVAFVERVRGLRATVKGGAALLRSADRLISNPHDWFAAGRSGHQCQSVAARMAAGVSLRTNHEDLVLELLERTSPYMLDEDGWEIA